MVKYKIHPSIGIARIGNSQTDYYIGPEIPGDQPVLNGNFRDSDGRIKRQAVRFRIFKYNDDDTPFLVNGVHEEINFDNAEIIWKVELGNKKALWKNSPNFGAVSLRNSDIADPVERENKLAIKTGLQSISGLNQTNVELNGSITFNDTVTSTDVTSIVTLGHLKTDEKGRLVVLGGFGKSISPVNASLTYFYSTDKWYDDISDGPISATIILNGNYQNPIEVGGSQNGGAWVVVAPPSFAPEIECLVTLYDTLRQVAIEKFPGHPRTENVPANPSFKRDILPILRRAEKYKWVQDYANVNLRHQPVRDVINNPTVQAYRDTVVNVLRNPNDAGDTATPPIMPKLFGYYNMYQPKGTSLAKFQYEIMQKFKSNAFTDDRNTPDPQATMTAEGLDRAGLETAVGAAFYPGIEVGWFVLDRIKFHEQLQPNYQPDYFPYDIYEEPFRFSHNKLTAGDITKQMALPWQADFYACADYWWPSHRPNYVFPENDSNNNQLWAREISSNRDMVAQWQCLGFIVKSQVNGVEKYLEKYRYIQAPTITQQTFTLDFSNTPEGPGSIVTQTFRAVVFDVSGCPSRNFSFEVSTFPISPKFTFPLGPRASVSVDNETEIAVARLWVQYETGLVGENLNDSLRIHETLTGQDFDVTIRATTIARPKTAVALILDRSGSMSQIVYDNVRKVDLLKQSLKVANETLLNGDGVGIIEYNQTSNVVLVIEQQSDAVRTTIDGLINDPNFLIPSGSTSIGSGMISGLDILNNSNGYDFKSMVVLTDGMDNTYPHIEDANLPSSIKTYAIGFGKETDISTAKLRTITDNTNGYLLITGAIDDSTRFRLSKYFLQIIAGVNNANIVTDPEGVLIGNASNSVSFTISDVDMGMEVILLSPLSYFIDFYLLSPTGERINETDANNEPTIYFKRTDYITYYRLTLPAKHNPSNHIGVWRAKLQIIDTDTYFERTKKREKIPSEIPYSLVVNSYSNLKLGITSFQTGNIPGSNFVLNATLLQGQIPVSNRSSIEILLTHPDGIISNHILSKIQPGQYQLKIPVAQPGTYKAHVKARAYSLKGYLATREHILTPAVWVGGDKDECCEKEPKVSIPRKYSIVLLLYLLLLLLLLLINYLK